MPQAAVEGLQHDATAAAICVSKQPATLSGNIGYCKATLMAM